ncbi:MAG TPA: rRNA maturation RNase YbeY [Bacteroidales bacterium]|nr:rRNA maturation RNase YbeY [Bacteroidales bacterium]HQB21898.1 rRNA maturation RNase YbeY [Bacteroidales bacterium]
MAVNFFAEDVEKPALKYRSIKQWIVSEIEKENFELGNINYIFCSDEYLLKMNIKHLEHDYYTDIISFDYCEDNLISGDLFISLDRIKENAVLFGTNESEVYRVMIHGILHLCGYKDDTEEESENMRKREDEALLRLDLI